MRAQISQIEKYNTAVNTFRGKYGYLPGDMPDPYASQFGFAARGTNPGQGDGDGILTGWQSGTLTNSGIAELTGETVVFWVDLGKAGMIPNNLTTASPTVDPPDITVTSITTPRISDFFPEAKIGGGNYIYAWSGGPGNNNDGYNYFGLSAVASIPAGLGSVPNSIPGITVIQAYSIDKKTDDGLPQAGSIIAHSGINWSQGIPGDHGGPSNRATPGSSVTCFDNGGNAGSTQQYSLSQNNGAGINCALSFKFR